MSVPPNDNDNSIKNLHNNKLSFLGEKIGLFYCVRVISARSTVAAAAEAKGDRLSLGYLVSAHGACLFFFPPKNTFRCEGWENSIFVYLFFFTTRIVCSVILLLLYYYFFNRKTNLVMRSSANFRSVPHPPRAPVSPLKKQLLLLTEAREFHGPRARALGQFNRGTDVRRRAINQPAAADKELYKRIQNKNKNRIKNVRKVNK